ncbi:hypothetical protein TSUD_318570 [Trifolium subterraneum]|uniref:NADPH oxidase Respiratory burst domain-containing protein n=1 Tax=Trifolium subterraneum TaxID=3900 RepID=A0A2Z6MW06_TRISU|nr:hypothetical protein TSUD_318570 [Trifolium subterraneum]
MKQRQIMGTNEIEVVSSELTERVHHNNGSFSGRKTKSNSVISPELEQDDEVTFVLQGDSITLESVKPVTDDGENIKLEKKISFGSSRVKTAYHLKQVSGELKRLATLSKKVKKYDRTESAAFHALKKLKFITVTKTVGAGDNGWSEVEMRFNDITKETNGLLHRSQFSKCIGMKDGSEDFGGELFDAMLRRRSLRSRSRCPILNVRKVEHLEKLLLHGSSDSTKMESKDLSQMLDSIKPRSRYEDSVVWKRCIDTINFLQDNWKRNWILVLWISVMCALFGYKFIQYRRKAAYEVMGHCVCMAKGAAETYCLSKYCYMA